MKQTIYFFLIILISLSGVFAGCQDSFKDLEERENRLIFVGSLLDGDPLQTRAPSLVGLPRDSFETKFYIARIVGDKKACGTYLIPREYPGLLRSYGDRDSLRWISPDEPHVFIGWTMPWVLDYPINDEEYQINYEPYIDNFEDGTTISFDADDPMYDELKEKNIDNTNCKILETFVGTRSDNLIFDNNGDFVRLSFRHLVSKIYIQSVRFSTIDDKGNVETKSVKGRITFKNMPSEGVFYREKPGFPVVEAKPNTKNEITYQIGSGATLYVCPGVDFSKVEFRISADSGITDFGEFLGDFKSVSFNRTETDWWDNEHSTDPNWETTLYAGETMTLILNLRQGKGTFVSVAINDWSTQNAREGVAYQYQGIFDSSQLRELYYEWGSDQYTDAMEDRIFNRYGDIYLDEDGNEIKEYRFYADCTWTNALRLGKKYSVNGMGHTITFTGTYNDNQIRTSRIKDVYLTDGNGHTVYINEDYEVFTVDENGQLTSTGKKLEPLEGNNNSYLINLTTGSFRQDPGI